MINNRSMKNTLLKALLIGFLGAAVTGGCAGMHDGRAGELGAEGEESGTLLALDQTYDEVRNGAHLVLRYDAEASAFVGTVRNATGATLRLVRVEVHLSNGTELGPTTPVDLAPGKAIAVRLTATTTAFTGWTAHAEVGPGHGAGGEGGGERREGGGEHRGGGEGGQHGSERESRGEQG